MCGITGYIHTNTHPIPDTSYIFQMLRAQKHRGPDDSGIRTFNLISGESWEQSVTEPETIAGSCDGVIGFNRLSILDLSSNGHQPMVSQNGMVILTLNGEIYNAFEFQDELEEWGYIFKSTTDTEIVLALYLRYGLDGMLTRLNGMFAIVIVDLKEKILYIIRDRFGIKPIYYTNTNNTIAFSSELKSFRYLDGFSFSLREEQLDEYLLFRTNLKDTLLKDIHSLEPGHYLAYRHGAGIRKRRYFDINDYTRSDKSKGDINFYTRQVEDWLGCSVKSQLMSDVKLGCQLSGGIDSSIVTWLANQNVTNNNFESVSIIFNDKRFSEEEFINRVRDKLNIPAHKFLLDSEYYLENFENATWHLESPINHPNTIGIFKLSQKAKEYVTVLLSGEGADEVFGGYQWFYDTRFPFTPRKLMHEVRSKLNDPIALFDYFSPDIRSIMATAFMSRKNAGRLYEGFNFGRATSNRRSLYGSLKGSLFDRQVKYELQVYMPDLLIRQDKMSMAHSIENRVPFLDNNVVENAFSIPETYLLLRNSPEGFNSEKYLLKKMTASIFGNDFAFRDKMGFGIPLREFFLNKKFSEYLSDNVLPGIKKRKLFNYNLVSKWLINIKQIGYNELEALWVAISFEIWASIYLDANNENWNT